MRGKDISLKIVTFESELVCVVAASHLYEYTFGQNSLCTSGTEQVVVLGNVKKRKWKYCLPLS